MVSGTCFLQMYVATKKKVRDAESLVDPPSNDALPNVGTLFSLR